MKHKLLASINKVKLWGKMGRQIGAPICPKVSAVYHFIVQRNYTKTWRIMLRMCSFVAQNDRNNKTKQDITSK